MFNVLRDEAVEREKGMLWWDDGSTEARWDVYNVFRDNAVEREGGLLWWNDGSSEGEQQNNLVLGERTSNCTGGTVLKGNRTPWGIVAVMKGVTVGRNKVVVIDHVVMFIPRGNDYYGPHGQ